MTNERNPQAAQTQSPKTTATLSPTQTPESPNTSSKEVSLEEASENAGVDAVGLNESTKRRVHTVLANFSENLPENETERREALLDTADSVCQAKRQNFTEDVNLSKVEHGGKEADKLARRLSYSSQIVNERFTDDVPVSDFKRLRDGAGKATKYTPVLGSTERFMEASCVASEERTDKSLREFQVAAMMVGVDLVLAYSGVGYSPAFKGTRFAMNKASQVGLYRLRYVCGNRCWALAWSETHWILRGEMIGAIESTALFAVENGLQLSESDLRYIAEQQGLNRSQMVELATRLSDDGIKLGGEVFGSIEECVSGVNASDAVDNPEQAAKKAKEKADGFVSGVLGKSDDETKQSGTVCEEQQ